MSEKINNFNEGGEGENKVSNETLYMPEDYLERDKSINANWRDDIEGSAEESKDVLDDVEPEYEDDLEFKPDNSEAEVDPTVMGEIGNFQDKNRLKPRYELKNIGSKTLRFVRKEKRPM